MKKLFTTPKFKKRNTIKAIRRERRKRVFKRKKRNKNFVLNGVNRKERSDYLVVKEQHKKYVKIRAPSNFSFIDNTEEFTTFITKVENQYSKRNKVFILLDKVEIVSYGAIVVLLSIMVKFKDSRIDFNGNKPDDLYARKMLHDSGFFEKLYIKKDNIFSINTKGNTIHTHGSTKVDSEFSAKIISEASKIVWGEPRRCQGVQRAFLELMHNTNNHAEIGAQGEKLWWLSVNHIEEENRVVFSFIDFGVGVFKSLESKKSESIWFEAKKKMNKAFAINSNNDWLRLMLEGEMHQTVTGKSYRGKGLPGIKNVMDKNQISNLHIITNNVVANVSDNKYEKISNDFSGTFVHWELNNSNQNSHV
jgi:hypothetical protein